jgi:hypothetical protein
MRLEGFQDMLAVLFGNGCRRDALLGATLGPELASQCPACDSCDRCCSRDRLSCAATARSEIELDLRAAARCLWHRLAREPRSVLRCADRELWRDLPCAVVASPSGCAQLVLLMLARRLLYFKPAAAGSGGDVLVCARTERRGMEAMRRSVLCVPAAAADVAAANGSAAADGSAAAAEAALDQMLAELGVMERRVACRCAHEELEALRCRCMRAAVRLGRKDLLLGVA